MKELGAVFDGARCHFRVWAPEARQVLVELECAPAATLPLKRQAGGYWTGSAEAARPGVLYRYNVDGTSLPDPCSRYQPEGPHGASAIVDRNTHTWSDQQWRGVRLEDLVLYELHIGTFTPEGTLAAAIGRLSHLRDLGITAVEIMPLAEFPGRFNWGYDGVSWFAPSRAYGPYDALKQFVDAAHAAGIGVILDVVYNHFGPDGNYTRNFSPFYFGSTGTEWGDSINYDGEQAGPVRELAIASACEWVREFHLDGLRLDATHSIFDTSRRHIVAELTAAVREAAGQRTVLVIAENETQCATHMLPEDAGGFGLDAMWNDDFHHTALVAATGRRHAYYQDYLGSPQEFISTARRGFLYQGQYYPWQQKLRGEPVEVPASRCVACLENHDQVANSIRGRRLHQLTAPALYRALTTVLLLGPQVPLLFMGQEFQSSAPFLFFADHKEPLRKLVRDGRRDFLVQFPGVASADGLAVLDDPGDEQTFLRSKLDWSQCATSNPALRLHRQLLALRRDDQVLSRRGRDGFDGAVLPGNAFVLRWFDAARADRLLVVNLGTEVHGHPMPEPLLAPPRGRRWSLLFSSEHADFGGSGSVDPQPLSQWRLPGQCAMLLAAVEAEPA
ncbi:MAG: malto-oligosyltrehalose trehalohydrolase [Pseudomonadota bacterium]|nr:malto-oligosyltrehalose trehalohydrolase [Pseudomonadota bacterium]